MRLGFSSAESRLGQVVLIVLIGCAAFSAACAAGGQSALAQEAPAAAGAAQPSGEQPSTTGASLEMQGVALPDGAGRQVVERICSGCHSIAYVGARRDTPEGWTQKVDEMIGYGARPSSDEADIIIKYLSENLPK